MRNLGCQSNNALRDQRVALQWLKQIIHGFGGDPDNITVMGRVLGAVRLSLSIISSWLSLY
jgi:para-nitrobenzyl esterase